MKTGDIVLMPLRKTVTIVTVSLILLTGVVALLVWRELPDQKVPRLLCELRDLPMEFDLFYFGRSHDQIQGDLDRLRDHALPSLVCALQSHDSRIRYLAAGQLGRLRDLRAVDPLIVALDDPDRIVEYWAISALGKIGDPRAVDSLLPRLASTDSSVRFLTAQALGLIGDKRAFEPLLDLIDDPELYPRAHAVEALGMLGDERALDILIRLVDSDEDSWVRAMGVKGLGALGDRRALPTLAEAAKDPDWPINEPALEAIERINAAKESH